MLTRRNRISLRTHARNVSEYCRMAIRGAQDDDEEDDGLERLAGFRSELEAARDNLDAVLDALDEAVEGDGAARENVQPRTPSIVTRES